MDTTSIGSGCQKFCLKRIGKVTDAQDMSERKEMPPGRLVLVVDDEESLVRLAARILERRGFVVLQTTSAIEAIELAAKAPQQIDVLVTDCVMPTMGGRELALRIQELSPDTAVVFMSGYTNDERLSDLTSNAANGFLMKPFGASALVQAVEAVLQS